MNKILLAALLLGSSATSTGLLAPAPMLASPDSDLAQLDAAVAGEWLHRSNGDRWNFGVDGSYLFAAGAARRRAGIVSHSGTWNVSNYKKVARDVIDSTGTLSLRTTWRVTSQSGRRRVVSGVRVLSVPAMFTEADGQIIINQVSYWQKGVTPD